MILAERLFNILVLIVFIRSPVVLFFKKYKSVDTFKLGNYLIKKYKSVDTFNLGNYLIFKRKKLLDMHTNLIYSGQVYNRDTLSIFYDTLSKSCPSFSPNLYINRSTVSTVGQF
jgi:hypothetical protein